MYARQFVLRLILCVRASVRHCNETQTNHIEDMRASRYRNLPDVPTDNTESNEGIGCQGREDDKYD